MKRSTTLTRVGVVAGLILASLALVAVSLLRDSSAHASTIGGTASISDTSGTALTGVLASTQPFTVTLPAAPNDACTGDTATDGYHVWSYLVPDTTAVTTITFGGKGPSTGYGYYLGDGYVGPLNTAPTTGQVVGIPLDLAWSNLTTGAFGVSAANLYDPNGVEATTAVWQSGIACANASGAVTDYWNDDVTFTKSLSDPNGYTWNSLPGPDLGGTFTPLTPDRILDTRFGPGPIGAVAAGGTLSLSVLNTGGVPDTGVGAVVLNVTVTQPKAGGYLTVWPDGHGRPVASNLNFAAGETVPNLVIAPVGTDGKVDFYNGSHGTVQILADVSGWFASGGPTAGGLTPLTPDRILDTRFGPGPVGAVAAGGTLSLSVLNTGGVPDTGVGAVVLNVTVTQPTAGGYLTVWPDGHGRPVASNLNFAAGETVPNLVIAPVGTDGKVDFYNGSHGTVQILADVSGDFSTPPP